MASSFCRREEGRKEGEVSGSREWRGHLRGNGERPCGEQIKGTCVQPEPPPDMAREQQPDSGSGTIAVGVDHSSDNGLSKGRKANILSLISERVYSIPFFFSQQCSACSIFFSRVALDLTTVLAQRSTVRTNFILAPKLPPQHVPKLPVLTPKGIQGRSNGRQHCRDRPSRGRRPRHDTTAKPPLQ